MVYQSLKALSITDIMNYNWAFPYIPKDSIQCIFELGARDCEDSITLHNHFNCPVTAFECNPDCIQECKKTLQTSDKPITLVEAAVFNEDTNIAFPPFLRERYDNIGSSSLFEIDFVSSRTPADDDYGKKDVQGMIEVKAIRLDSYIKETNQVPDLICMDIQEAELLALQGLGEWIKRVKFIILEGSMKNTYKGGCTFSDVHQYLLAHNFRFVKSKTVHGLLPEQTQYFSFCDLLYVNNINV